MGQSAGQRRSVLAGIELFAGIGDRELERLERLGRRRHYAAGEAIVREGESGIALFAITSGRVRVSQRQADGQERELRTIGPGGWFGEMALFSNRRRSASVTALEPTECLALHRLDFLDELRKSPDVAIRLLDTLSQRLVDAQRPR